MERDGTKTRMSRADRRAQLLSVAREMIRSDGLGALTMAGLAERAAVAKPVVYTHFKGSRHVAIALLDEHFEVITKLFEERVSAAITLSSYVESVVEAAFAFESVSEIPVRKIANGFSAGDEVNQVFLRHEAAFREHWQQLLILMGVPADRTVVAASILSAMVGSAIATSKAEELRHDRATLTLLLTAALDALTSDNASPGQRDRTFDEPVYRLIQNARIPGLIS